jgi:hypothetical protein
MLGAAQLAELIRPEFRGVAWGGRASPQSNVSQESQLERWHVTSLTALKPHVRQSPKALVNTQSVKQAAALPGCKRSRATTTNPEQRERLKAIKHLLRV